MIDGRDLTLGQLLDAWAAEYGDGPAMRGHDRSAPEGAQAEWTYAQFADDVRALHRGLSELGVAKGDRVVVCISSFPEWILLFFALARLGAVFCPVNPRFGTHELDYVLRKTRATTLVAMGRYLNRDYGAMVAELGGRWEKGGTAEKLPALRHLVGLRGLDHPAATDFAAVLQRGREGVKAHGVLPAETDRDLTALLIFTSGTTSFPKGVPLSHGNILPHTVRSGELMKMDRSTRVLNLYPFFGVSGVNKLLTTFGAGACLYFLDSFRAEEAFDLMVAENCEVIHAVDAQARELVKIAVRRGVTLPERRGTFGFSAGVNEALVKEMGETLGLRRFVHAYGMTETCAMILRNTLDDEGEAQIRAGGRIAPDVEIRVVDSDTGADRPVGETGEIVVRGRNVTKGYFEDPEAWAEVFRGGWFYTGDLGVRTADGFLYYIGRKKDMMKPGGFNVAPQEVEAFLRTHPDVEDAAVSSAPDERLGETIVAFVKCREGRAVSEEDLAAFSRGRIANFKVPKKFAFVDALPFHTAAHGPKLQRNVLKEWAAKAV